MSALINTAINPSFWLVFLGAVGVVLLWAGWRRAGRSLVSIAAAGWVLIAVLPVDQWVLSPLENRFPQASIPSHVDGIVVLGGAVESWLSKDHGQPALNAGADRLTEFVIIARQHPEARLVFTGGPPPSHPNGPREADFAEELVLGMGIEPSRLTLERRATTTWENAIFTRELVNPKPGETWLLITSANHIPRSMGAFRAAGWEMIAVPVGYKTYLDMNLRHGRSLGDKLQLVELAAHEWVGLLNYWFAGHSTALFPAPLGQPSQP